MIAGYIIKYRWLIILLYGLLTIGSILLLPGLKIDVDFSNFFPKGDRQVKYYEHFVEKMGSNDHFIAVAIVPETNIFDLDFLQSADDFTAAAGAITQVESATSITTISRYLNSPFGIISLPYIHLGDTGKLQQDSNAIYRDYELTQPYISKDGKCLIVMLQIKEKMSPLENDTAISRIQALVDRFDFHETHMAGKKLLEVQYQRLMKDELSSSVLLTFLVIIIMLFLFHRSFLQIILPLASMSIALLMLYGFLSITGRSLGIMSSLFPTIILIVGISDSVHIITKYNLEIAKSKSARDAVNVTIREIGLSIALTSITTIIGFLTLTTSIMPAMRSFGIDASVGILFAFLVSIMWIPAILSFISIKIGNKKKPDILRWANLSGLIYSFILRRKKLLIVVTIFALALSGWGISMINTNNLQMTNIPKDDRIRADYQFFDNTLHGTRSMELAVEMKDSSLLNTRAVLQEIRKLHDHLSNNPALDNIVSPVTWYHGISKIFDRQLAPLEIPESDELIRENEKRLTPYYARRKWKLVDDAKRIGRISARLEDPGRQEAKKLNQEITTWINGSIDTSMMSFHFVGMDMMLDLGHEHRIKNMIWGILLALVMVALLIGLLFKSLKMVFVTLIANTIPLIVIAGLMGFSGVELRGSTSIIFVVGFVIAVDDTIHFLSKFRMERKKGRNVREAIRISLLETGKAIITTSLILCAGFAVLMSSPFGDVYTVGFLVSSMVLIAVLADILLVPLLLMLMLDQTEKISTG